MNSRKIKAFTILETAFSLLILLIICQLLLELTQTSQSLANRLKKSRESPEIAVIQLEQNLKGKAIMPATADDGFYYFGKNEAGKDVDYHVYLRLKQGEIVASNSANQGYMPLWYGVKNVKFTYKAPLLTMEMQQRDGQTLTAYFLAKEWKKNNENETPTTR